MAMSLSHGMNTYSVVSMPNSIWRIGIMRAKEKMLKTAEKMVRMIDQIRLPLYGAT
jgi:hypothetical protein